MKSNRGLSMNFDAPACYFTRLFFSHLESKNARNSTDLAEQKYFYIHNQCAKSFSHRDT